MRVSAFQVCSSCSQLGLTRNLRLNRGGRAFAFHSGGFGGVGASGAASAAATATTTTAARAIAAP